MITIQNIGPHNDSDPHGVRQYRLRVNGSAITAVDLTFTHRRADGLARCLELAAAAVRKHHQQHIDTLVEAIVKDKIPRRAP